MNMRKGISPLIAVIMLIAFTMIVAGILAGWATTFVTTQREELQFCSKAQLLIQRAYYEPETSTNGTLTLHVLNTGSVALKGFSVRTIYKKNASAIHINSTIQPQDIKTITVDITDPNNLDQVIIQSVECRGAQDMITRYDIQGIGF